MKVELTYKNFQKKKISYLKMRWLTTEKHSNELCQTKQTHQTNNQISDKNVHRIHNEVFAFRYSTNYASNMRFPYTISPYGGSKVRNAGHNQIQVAHPYFGYVL